MKANLENRAKNFFKENSSENSVFVKACHAVPPPHGKPGEGIKPTERQASKWLHGKGAAWKFGR